MQNISVDSDTGWNLYPNNGHGEEFRVAYPDQAENRANEKHDLSVDADPIYTFLLVDFVEE